MSVGALNPCPVRCGGGLSETEKAYRCLKQAVGTGGSADEEQTIEALWRRSKAKGLAAATSGFRRAVHNAFVHLATDALPYWERVLGLVATPGQADATRRAVVWATLVTRLSAVLPSLQTQLEAIDSRLSLQTIAWDEHVTTQPGRVFGPHDLSVEGPFLAGAGGASIAPNYATTFTVNLLFDVGYLDPLTPSDAKTLQSAKDMLLEVLPSWVDYSIVTSVAFILNSSPLDLTGLRDP